MGRDDAVSDRSGARERRRGSRRRGSDVARARGEEGARASTIERTIERTIGFYPRGRTGRAGRALVEALVERLREPRAEAREPSRALRIRGVHGHRGGRVRVRRAPTRTVQPRLEESQVFRKAAAAAPAARLPAGRRPRERKPCSACRRLV